MSKKRATKSDLLKQIEAQDLKIKLLTNLGETDQKRIQDLEHQRHKHLEAIAIMAGAGNVSPSELVQLGVGSVTENPNWKSGDNPRDRYTFTVMDLGDLVDMNKAAMHQKATVAKFRQIKQHFQTHQKATSFILDQLEAITSKNNVTGEDLDKIREIREQLSDIVGRKI